MLGEAMRTRNFRMWKAAFAKSEAPPPHARKTLIQRKERATAAGRAQSATVRTGARRDRENLSACRMNLHFDLVDLKLMLRIAEANSLTRGAEASHLSLSAASTRIKNLEDAIGVKLLYRTSQGVTLTQAGQALVYHARLVVGQLEQLSGDLQEYGKGIRGHVRLHVNTTAMEFLPPVLRDYLQSHPDVNIDLQQRLSHATVRALLEGSADIGIVAGDVRTESLEVIPWRRDRLVLVVPPTHPLAGRQAVDFAECLEYQHIGLAQESAISSFLRQVCDSMNRRMSLRVQVGDFESACRMIEAGVGVGVVPGSAAHRHRQAMEVRVLELNDAWAPRVQMLCMRKLDALPAFARELVDALVAHARAAETAATPEGPRSASPAGAGSGCSAPG